jgi:hypothetical protein
MQRSLFLQGDFMKLYAYKKCSCGIFHTFLPEKNQSLDGLVYFDCSCGSTLVISSKLMVDQLLNNAWETRLEAGEYDLSKKKAA